VPDGALVGGTRCGWVDVSGSFPRTIDGLLVLDAGNDPDSTSAMPAGLNVPQDTFS